MHVCLKNQILFCAVITILPDILICVNFIQGEILFPKSTDKPVASSGLRKTNAIVMEPDTDKLTVQSSRYAEAFVKQKNSMLG